MKNETYVSIILLALFTAAVVFGGELVQYVIYMYGCLMFGWNVPVMSEFIVDRVAKKED